jgi:hypothetical protein
MRKYSFPEKHQLEILCGVFFLLLTPVTETMPGIALSRDVTDVTVAQGFWPSFNTPYFSEIFNVAGYPEKIAAAGATGSWYSYTNGSRFKIFSRDAPTVTNFAQFRELMNSNNWENDTLSNGDPAQQIMARYDLRPADCIWGSRRAYGGLDVKATSVLRALAFMSFDAIGSPTHEKHPPFNFSDPEWAGLNHDGIPAVWNFSWTAFGAQGFDRCGGALEKGECTAIHACGWCIYDQKCLLGFEGGPALGATCEAGWVVAKELQSWAVPLIAAVAAVSGLLMIGIYGFHFVTLRKRQAYAGL